MDSSQEAREKVTEKGKKRSFFSFLVSRGISGGGGGEFDPKYFLNYEPAREVPRWSL